MTEFSRRSLFAGAATLAATPALLGTTSSAQAQISAGQQVPGVYRYKVGDIEITAMNDGARSFPLPDGFVKNASREQVNAALEAAFLPKDEMTIQFNPLLVNSGGKLVLIDTGNGPQQQPGATVGKLIDNLGWAGVKPSDIDTVIITHFHGDHINGLRAADGGLAFPNAEILVPAPELAFWTDEARFNAAPDAMKGAFNNVKRVFSGTESRVKPFEWDKELAPGITSVDASGHTPGHTALLVTSGDDKLFIQADITNNPALFVVNPDWHVQFDMDAEKAAQTRRRTYDMLASDRIKLTGYHFPFPAAGFIEKSGEGFRLVPAWWNPVL